MARRRRRTQSVDPDPPTGPILHWRGDEYAEAPGPDADENALHTYAKWLNDRRACLAYERVVTLCGWCLADAPFISARVSAPRGPKLYCSERCAKAYDAFASPRGGATAALTVPATPIVPSDSGTPDDAAQDAPTTVEQITEIVGEEGQGRVRHLPGQDREPSPAEALNFPIQGEPPSNLAAKAFYSGLREHLTHDCEKAHPVIDCTGYRDVTDEPQPLLLSTPDEGAEFSARGSES